MRTSKKYYTHYNSPGINKILLYASWPADMTQRGRGSLEVKPSNNPFFCAESAYSFGVDIKKKESKVEWSGAINPNYIKSAKMNKTETFGFLYTRESDSIGGRVAKPVIDRPKMLTKTEFLKKWRDKRTPTETEQHEELLPEPTPVDVERVLQCWKQGTKVEDPRYTTTNNEIGRKTPTVATFVSERHSIPQGFSAGFNGVKPQNSGLNTGLTKSNVHPSLDPQFA